MSPEPRPCSAETANGSPSPRFQSPWASASVRWSSTLLAASTTGLPDLRRILTTASSGVGDADRGVDDEEHGVGQRHRDLGLGAIRSARPWASGSQPPVSTTVKARPFQLAS